MVFYQLLAMLPAPAKPRSLYLYVIPSWFCLFYEVKLINRKIWNIWELGFTVITLKYIIVYINNYYILVKIKKCSRYLSKLLYLVAVVIGILKNTYNITKLGAVYMLFCTKSVCIFQSCSAERYTNSLHFCLDDFYSTPFVAHLLHDYTSDESRPKLRGSWEHVSDHVS